MCRICRQTQGYVLKLLLMLLSIAPAYAQTIRGKIIDGADKQPVSFAAIVIDKSNTGTTADLDGNFSINVSGSASYLGIQMVGYLSTTVSLGTLSTTKENIITMAAGGVKLSEIVVKPGINPAIAIISKVISSKPKFDISNLPYYYCSTYSKTYFTLSDGSGDEDFYNQDSLRFSKTKKLLSRSYLFFIESVTEKKYRYKNKAQEKIIASKTSGFKSGPFGAFASQLQSFTFYDDKISLLGLNYISPLIKGTFKRYNFEITDTIIEQSDTTLLIRFYPKKNTVFEAMKGLLYINKNQYVLTNVLAEPNELVNAGHGIKIQQLYQKVDSLHWFPKQLNTELLFDTQKQGTIKQMMKAVSRQYISEVRLDSAVQIKNRNLLLYEAGNTNRDEAFWNSRRHDLLNKKETQTYRFIDSVSKAEKLEQKFKVLEALTTGKLPVGYVDADLNRILRLNDYEGVRLGLGLSSSDKVSRWFSIGGYAGYGFSDKAWKYGGNLNLNLSRSKLTYIQLEAAREVIETAGVQFLKQANMLADPEAFRDLLVSKMDKVGFGRVSFNTSVYRFIRLSAFFDVRQQTSPFGFLITDAPNNAQHTFNVNTAGLRFRIWPGEKFSQSMGQLMSMGSKWPMLCFNISKGLTNTLDAYTGTFSFTKIDLRLDHKINFRVKGYFNYELQAGKVFGAVPYSLMYNNKGSHTSSYALSVEKSMETMYMNQFTSTQYAGLFLALNFGQLFKPHPHIRPEIELVHNYMIGSLDHKQLLAANVPLRDLSKGYSEAGLRLKNIYISSFSGFGAGFFYRYGNYAAASIKSNLVIKLVYNFAF